MQDELKLAVESVLEPVTEAVDSDLTDIDAEVKAMLKLAGKGKLSDKEAKDLRLRLDNIRMKAGSALKKRQK